MKLVTITTVDGCVPALVRNIVKLDKQFVLICAKFTSVMLPSNTHCLPWGSVFAE